MDKQLVQTTSLGSDIGSSYGCVHPFPTDNQPDESTQGMTRFKGPKPSTLSPKP